MKTKLVTYMKTSQTMMNKQLLSFALLSTVSVGVNAQAIDTGFITTFGCVVYDYLTGSLALWGFLIAVIGALLIGLFTKVDWSSIIKAVALFAVLQSIASVVITTDYAQKHLRGASCLNVSK